MSFDPTGTAPGLAPDAQTPEPVNMKCRNEKCDSITAIVINIAAAPGQRLYRCTKCSHSWGLNVGGSFNI